ncbi:MAG TPA: LLM class F420-dependent oxidoreductase [Galbitalea sp.]|jgi:F420-dependent oxidoreductase-like protein|nr:LLM class F420-dependent oxidoreductase [Galbitalea sp.]
MDLRIFVEPQQGASYEGQLAGALLAEKLGFDAYFRSDHYLTMDGDGLPGPTDSWITLAGLARETSTIRLGTLVSSATFRHPGVLAISVAQVDAMSGGRVELGLGTGWFEAEHRAYGIPFPQKRFGPFEEQLEIITGLWSTPVGGRYSFSGKHYELTDSPALPKPVQSPIPIIVGGGGAQRTPAIAARFASEYNIGFVDERTIAEKFAGVRRACEDAGRDPDSIIYSVALPTQIGSDERDYLRRAADRDRDPVEFRSHNIAGTPGEALEKLARLAALGAGRVYLQTEIVSDLEQIELLGTEVLPHVA